MAITRKRRSGIERRSLSKAAKRLFMGMPRSVLRFRSDNAQDRALRL